MTGAKEQNSDVRVALAESTELLVRQEEAHLPLALRIASVHGMWDVKTFVGPVQPVSSWLVICVSSAYSKIHDVMLLLQVATDKGSQVLWDLKAPEMLRKG